MNTTRTEVVDDAVLEQAAHWCMWLLDNSCSADERLEFQQWVQADPRHAFEYAKMLEIWDLSEHLPAEPGTAKTLLTGHLPGQAGARRI
ncbi:protein of unknown function [Pseudomonas helmanticensis]|uniref:Uncharacterized protein n=1 Tax=Pseudomonas helmanticensis TaxID=1471381 RepID=A0ACD2U3R5_9PSED|nr:DUF4880 domain-containing protein [Pseudomonas helmanticensis]SMQ24397.1 protein of unknown function [Pseudomonas helmanticensis]